MIQLTPKLTPSQYAILHGATLYDWQIEALEAFGKGWPTALLTCNGAGKTAVVAAWAAAWFFYRYPKGKMPATSGSFNQLQNQLWPALEERLPDCSVTSGNSPCTIKTPTGGKALGFSTNDEGKAEGWHPTIDGDTDPVFILVDEGKTVPEGIFNAFDRCTKKFQLYISSAGAPRGRFFNCFNELAGEYYTIIVSYLDCPHLDREKIEKDRRIYGDEHPIFKSMHLAEFTTEDGRMVLDIQNLTRAMKAQPEIDTTGETVAFCDFAAGGDENVLAVKHGNRVRIIKAWKERDTVQASREFIQLFKDNQISAGEIWGDADGLGTVMIDIIAEEGWIINRFHGGAASTEPKDYANLIAEVWHSGALEIQKGRINLGELDPLLARQLTTRKSEWNDNGKLRVESKEKMAKAGVKSPDRADAVLGCIVCGSHLTGAISGHDADKSVIPEADFEGAGGVEF